MAAWQIGGSHGGVRAGAVLGPLPVIYLFIVNNPGEAAQAKRRICALTIGHMTPPLTLAGNHGPALEIEALFDEYAIAESLDPKRARLLSQAILERARDTGLLQDSGLKDAADPAAALRHLDAWLCDLKDMRIADGLHVFGHSRSQPCVMQPSMHSRKRSRILRAARRWQPVAAERMRALIDRCGKRKKRRSSPRSMAALSRPDQVALHRADASMCSHGTQSLWLDPRAVPTRTAWKLAGAPQRKS